MYGGLWGFGRIGEEVGKAGRMEERDVRLVNVPVKARPAVRRDCPDGMYMLNLGFGSL